MNDLLAGILELVDPLFDSESRFLLISAGLFFLSALILFPPSEPLAASTGIALARYEHHLLPVLIVAIVCCHLGSCFWYALGRRSQDKPAENRGAPSLARRWMGPLYGLTLRRLETGLDVDGGRLLIALRNVPLIRSLVSFPAAQAGLAGRRFHLSSIAGISIWLPIWVVAGLLFGEAIERYAPPLVVAIFSAFCVAAYFYAKHLGKRILQAGNGLPAG